MSHEYYGPRVEPYNYRTDANLFKIFALGAKYEDVSAWEKPDGKFLFRCYGKELLENKLFAKRMFLRFKESKEESHLAYPNGKILKENPRRYDEIFRLDDFKPALLKTQTYTQRQEHSLALYTPLNQELFIMHIF
ncbi:unnamed protein product [Ambrosiozyma monospora]|uniref:Unnamed protein product n=1 Tax=Ambrosiozyma monospora TaxID=43982 RepID=A0ACB5SSG9_AMBMO|nr:unnamed protein product [Ambrosiozyma monospora]